MLHKSRSSPTNPPPPPPPPPPGDNKLHRHTKLHTFPSLSHSSGTGLAADEVPHSLKLGWRSSKQHFGTPMKKLLAEEMSRETEAKRRGPGAIAKLMGLDGLPAARVGKNRGGSTAFEGRSSRRSSKDQLEFKDVFEVLEIPEKVDSSRYSLKGSVDLEITDDEMSSFVERKFIDAERRATYQDLRSSQVSNDDLLVKYFRWPNSLIERHLEDLQAAPLQSHSGLMQAIKSLDVENHGHGDFRWKLDREATRLNCTRSRQKHHGDYPCHTDRRHEVVRSSPNSSKLQFKGRREPDDFPRRIVILKPNLGKVQNAATIAVSSPCATHAILSERGKLTELSDARFVDVEPNQKKHLPDTAWHSRQNSLESREIAKEISSQMKNSLNNCSVIFSPSRFRGYMPDDSSCSSSGGDEAPEESEVTTVSLENSFDITNTSRPSSRSSESSVSREAKKRLSDRWKKTQKSEQRQSISRSSTLAEMLATPDKETKAAPFDRMSCGEGFHDKAANNGKLAGRVEPLGISSRDGWRDGCIGSLPRSRSLPASSTAFGSARTILHHEALHDDRYTIPKYTLKRERKKVVKCLDERRCVNNRRSSRSAHKKSWSSHSSNIESDESSPDLRTIQNKAKINLEEDSPKQQVLLAESLAEILGDTSTVSEGVLDVTVENVPESSESSNEEQSVGSSSKSSISFQPPVAGIESSCCKNADQPSPVSVLEPAFTDNASPSSECFESLSVDPQGLRMQLQLLKLESEEYAEGTMQISSDEDGGEASAGISENNGLCRTEDSWESSYVIDVLSESGIAGAQPHTLLRHVSLSVFDELEKRYSDRSTCLRSERRLLFDRINSGISDIHEQFMNVQPWITPATPILGSKLIKNGMQDYLYIILGSQGKARDTALGKVLVSEEQWLKLRDEIDVIGREFENLLLDDLISEIIASSYTFCT